MGTSDVYLQRWARPAVNIYVHTYYWHTIGNLKVITSPSSNSKLIEILLNWSLCLCQYPPIQDLKMLTVFTNLYGMLGLVLRVVGLAQEYK